MRNDGTRNFLRKREIKLSAALDQNTKIGGMLSKELAHVKEHLVLLEEQEKAEQPEAPGLELE